MGEDRRGAYGAVSATWVALLLCVITSVCAVEGRWAFFIVEMMRGEAFNLIMHLPCLKQEASEAVRLS